jgi:hypothetical protein
VSNNEQDFGDMNAAVWIVLLSAIGWTAICILLGVVIGKWWL